MKKKLPQGVRKYIRRQKMVIRKSVREKTEQERLIGDLLDRVYKD